MKIDINNKGKIIALWLNHDEDPFQKLPIEIENKIEIYRKEKYRICIYKSGNNDIKKDLRNLILNNAQ